MNKNVDRQPRRESACNRLARDTAAAPAPRVTWDVEAVRWLGAIGASAGAWYLLPWYVSAIPIGIGALAALKRFVLQDTFGGFPVWTFRNDVAYLADCRRRQRRCASRSCAPVPGCAKLQPDDSERAPRQLAAGDTVDAQEAGSSPTLARSRRKSG